MKIKDLLILIILFSSCNRLESKKTGKLKISDTIKSDTSSIATECIQKDTITQLGTFIRYSYSKGQFAITWGDNTYSRTYDSLYSCAYVEHSGVWDFVPKIKSETKNTLVLTNIMETSSGGNPAPLDFYAIILPKNKIDTAFEKELFIDCKGVYLIYGDWENENIHILNLETKQQQNIILMHAPDISRAPTMAVKETSIQGRIFSIKYEIVDKNDNLKLIGKKIELKI